MRKGDLSAKKKERKCRACGCTDSDWKSCFSRTGTLCHWIESDLCSACEGVPPRKRRIKRRAKA